MTTRKLTWKKERRADRITKAFLIFIFGVIAGYAWAAAAYGIF